MDIKQELVHEDEDSQLGLIIKKTRQLEFSESMKKCGEIYLKEYQSFVIVCIHCNTLFSEYEDFMFHLKFDHGNVVAKPETLTEANVTQSYNVKEVDCTNFVEVSINPSIKSEIDNSEESISNPRVQIQKNDIDPISHLAVEVVKKKRTRKFSCILCEKNFRTKKSLNEHIEVTHNEQRVTNLIKNDEDQLNNKNDSDSDYSINESNNSNLKEKEVRIRKFLCGVCKKTFNTKKAFLEHEAIPHNLETTKNTSNYTNDSEIDSRFECGICKKSFTRKQNLNIHSFKHKKFEEQPYKCESCKKFFYSQLSLDAHIRWHNGDSFPCRICSKPFYRIRNRDIHEEIHGEKNLLCTFCGKKFFKRSSLKDHLKRHQGIKPYKCDFCEISFTSRYQLSEHRKKHTGEKPYECDICNARFSIRNSLKMHKKLHSDTADYKCNICGKSFKQFAGLYVHKKSH